MANHRREPILVPNGARDQGAKRESRPVWANALSPWGVAWSEVLESRDWFHLFPKAPPFSDATELRLRVLRLSPDSIPRVLVGSEPWPNSLLSSPLAKVMDAGPKRLAGQFERVESRQVEALLDRAQEPEGLSELNPSEVLLVLLSPAAAAHRKRMVGIAAELTCRQFERRIQLYAPLYVSNACTNLCSYCGFNYESSIARLNLQPEAIAREAAALADQGVRHVLLLTGEAPRIFNVMQVADAVSIAREYFETVSIEVFPMSEHDYGRVVDAGATGLTLYQETYDPVLYRQVHRAGRKRDILFRLEAPERGIAGGMRRIGLGVLLGLGDWRFDALALGLHAQALTAAYPQTTFTLSFPRLRPAPGVAAADHPVSDEELLQLMSALRLVCPRVGFVLSTRESVALRDQLAPLLVTQMSAGSSTRPGGYSPSNEPSAGQQFEIADPRTIQQMKTRLIELGLRVVGGLDHLAPRCDLTEGESPRTRT